MLAVFKNCNRQEGSTVDVIRGHIFLKDPLCRVSVGGFHWLPCISKSTDLLESLHYFVSDFADIGIYLQCTLNVADDRCYWHYWEAPCKIPLTSLWPHLHFKLWFLRCLILELRLHRGCLNNFWNAFFFCCAGIPAHTSAKCHGHIFDTNNIYNY